VLDDGHRGETAAAIGEPLMRTLTGGDLPLSIARARDKSAPASSVNSVSSGIGRQLDDDRAARSSSACEDAVAACGKSAAW